MSAKSLLYPSEYSKVSAKLKQNLQKIFIQLFSRMTFNGCFQQ